jgi:putative ABC transport system permease protein
MTRAYAENKDQLPNDLALLDVSELISKLKSEFSNVEWTPRIKFGGLIDVPDDNGETRAQGPTSGLALDLLSNESSEIKRMNIESSLVSGRLPRSPNEAILGDDFAKKLDLKLGDQFTYFGTTMNGSMTFQNFTVSATIKFGTAAMDKGAVIIDLSAAQSMLDMEDGAGELLGFLGSGVYQHDVATSMSADFESKFGSESDEFAPVMLPLKKQNNLEGMIDYSETMSSIFVFIFIMAMSVVLWNTGLLGGLRRYQEFGIRLALGESKSHIYMSLITEAVLIGIAGSIVGTIIGLAATYYLQVVGIDITAYMKNISMIMPSVIRAKVTPDLFFIGFIPGVLAMVFGTMLAGIGIYKRETANLFKELEV